MSVMSMPGEVEGLQAPPAGRDLDLKTLGRSLRRHRLWIFGPALACFLGAVAFVSLVQPRYTADAKVIVENGESYFTRSDKTDQQMPPPLPDDEAVQSEVQLISSRDLARDAINRLELKGNPEFDPLAAGLNPFRRLAILLGLERDPASVSAEDRILQGYYDHLQVFPLVKSRVITIEFTATDPELAARAANTIADLYIQAQSDAKRARARAAGESLATLIADLRTRTTAAEAKASEFRSRSGLLVGNNNTTITAQQLADVTTQLAQSRTAEADAQAKANLIREMLRQGRLSEVPDIANNELIRRVSEQRITLKSEVALQSRTLLPGHPRMQELNAQLADVDAQLRAAAEKAARTLENDAHIAAGRVVNLTQALEAQKRTASDAGADQVQLNTLETQARLLKDQLEFNTAKYQEALARESATATPADARVISRADPPQVPSFPKKLPIILIATLAALILSTGLVIARELLSGRAFDGSGDADLPVQPPLDLGLKPGFGHEDDRLAADPPAAVADEDVVAQLRRRIHESEGALRVLFTAGDPSHDAAQVTIAIARQLSEGVRTILIDLDGEVPAAVRTVGVPTEDGVQRGFGDLIAETASFAEIIHRDAGSRLHVVPMGSGGPASWDAADCRLVIDALAEAYDALLIHLPPADCTAPELVTGPVDAAVLVCDDDPSGRIGELRATLEDLAPGRVLLVDIGNVLPRKTMPQQAVA